MKTEPKRKSLVKLTGVRAISREHHSPKLITKETNDVEYQRVGYLSTGVQEQTNNYIFDLYIELEKIFKKYNTFQPFSSVGAIQKLAGVGKGKKILLILPAKGSEKHLHEIIKSKDKNSHLILVGEAQPNNFYLNQIVVLVTNSAQKILEFLDAKHLIQLPLKLDLQQFIRTQQFYGNNQELEKRSNELIGIKSNQPASQQPVVVNVIPNEYQFQRKQIMTSPQNKHKVKRLKSPIKSRPNTESAQQPTSPQNLNTPLFASNAGTLNDNNEFRRQLFVSNIGSINETNELKRSRQVKITPKEQVQVPPPYSAPAIQASGLNIISSSPSSIKQISQHQTESYVMRKSVPSQNYNQINNKYRSSYVIPQTSDEYRGSNKDSLLNQQFDKSRQESHQTNNYVDTQSRTKYYTHVETPSPHQERGEKKLVHSLTSDFNMKQTYGSNQKNRDMAKQGNANTNVDVQAADKATQLDEIKKLKILKKGQNIAPLQVHIQSQMSVKEPEIEPKPQKNEIKTSQNEIGYYNASYPTNYLQNMHKSTNTHTNYHVSSSNQIKPASSYQATNVRVIQVNTSPLVRRQPIRSPQFKVYGGTSPSSSIRIDKTNYATKTFNIEGYERVEVNGIAMYRKKVQPKPANIETHEIDSSPKVIRYQVSPRQKLSNYSNEIPNQNQQQVVYNRSSTYVPQYLNYSNAINYDQVSKTVQNSANVNSSYRPSEYEYNKMSYSRQGMKSAISKENLSLKILPSQDEFIERVGVGVQRELQQKAEVQRREYKQLKVQSPNLRLLNDSNWLSKPSDLHSDGSILRRNNIRFGIKLKQKQQKLNQSCVNQTKLQNGIFNINDLNKQMALHRKIVGQEEISSQQKKYVHINTQLSAIHYLFQEELRYYEKKINVLFGPQDKVDFFSCMQELQQKAYSLMDCGFVILIKEQGQKVNPTMLPQDYYVIFIEKSEDYLLEIDGDNKKIRVDSLERLTLAQKIILDSKLYQYVIYKGGDALVQGLGDKFANTQFIAEKLEIQLSNQILDCYYEDQPRLTRLYILCLQEQLKNTLKVIEGYEKTNPFFNRASCKVICPLKNSTNIQRLIKDFPVVLFLTTLSLSYKEIILQAHKSDKRIQLNIKPDRLYLHQKQAAIAADIQKQFPGRFQIIVFESLQSIAKKTSKYQLQKFNSYLVLTDSVSGQKLVAQNFTKVFMMGRAKALPNNVVRVMKKQELIQLLKK